MLHPELAGRHPFHIPKDIADTRLVVRRDERRPPIDRRLDIGVILFVRGAVPRRNIDRHVETLAVNFHRGVDVSGLPEKVPVAKSSEIACGKSNQTSRMFQEGFKIFHFSQEMNCEVLNGIRQFSSNATVIMVLNNVAILSWEHICISTACRSGIREHMGYEAKGPEQFGIPAAVDPDAP